MWNINRMVLQARSSWRALSDCKFHAYHGVKNTRFVMGAREDRRKQEKKRGVANYFSWFHTQKSGVTTNNRFVH